MLLVVQMLHTSLLMYQLYLLHSDIIWKGTGGFSISFICFSKENDPSNLMSSFRRDLKNAIKGCTSQMKTFLIEYLDLMIILTTISRLDKYRLNIDSSVSILSVLGHFRRNI